MARVYASHNKEHWNDFPTMPENLADFKIDARPAARYPKSVLCVEIAQYLWEKEDVEGYAQYINSVLA